MIFNFRRFNTQLSKLETIKNNQEYQLNPLRKLQIKNSILEQIKNPNINHGLDSETELFQKRYFDQERKLKMIKYIISSLIGLSLIGGTAFASTGAKPGDLLFPIKKAEENVQLNMAFSEQAKANLQTKFAEERAQELDEVSADANTTTKADENILQARQELSNAIGNLSEVETKLQSKGNTTSAEAVARIIAKLKEKELDNEDKVKIKSSDQNENDQKNKNDQNDDKNQNGNHADDSINNDENTNISLPNINANLHSDLHIKNKSEGQNQNSDGDQGE